MGTKKVQHKFGASPGPDYIAGKEKTALWNYTASQASNSLSKLVWASLQNSAPGFVAALI